MPFTEMLLRLDKNWRVDSHSVEYKTCGNMKDLCLLCKKKGIEKTVLNGSPENVCDFPIKLENFPIKLESIKN